MPVNRQDYWNEVIRLIRINFWYERGTEKNEEIGKTGSPDLVFKYKVKLCEGKMLKLKYSGSELLVKYGQDQICMRDQKGAVAAIKEIIDAFDRVSPCFARERGAEPYTEEPEWQKKQREAHQNRQTYEKDWHTRENERRERKKAKDKALDEVLGDLNRYRKSYKVTISEPWANEKSPYPHMLRLSDVCIPAEGIRDILEILDRYAVCPAEDPLIETVSDT